MAEGPRRSRRNISRGQSAQPVQSAPEPATRSKKGSTKVSPETYETKVVPENPHKRIKTSRRKQAIPGRASTNVTEDDPSGYGESNSSDERNTRSPAAKAPAAKARSKTALTSSSANTDRKDDEPETEEEEQPVASSSNDPSVKRKGHKDRGRKYRDSRSLSQSHEKNTEDNSEKSPAKSPANSPAKSPDKMVRRRRMKESVIYPQETMDELVKYIRDHKILWDTTDNTVDEVEVLECWKKALELPTVKKLDTTETCE